MTKEEMVAAVVGHAVYKDYGREGAFYGGTIEHAETRGDVVLLRVKVGHDRITEALRMDTVERLLDGQHVTMDEDARVTIRF